MRKPTQPRDTRDSRDSRPAVKTWTPANFRKEDWNFSDCRDDELPECFAYEFSRHSQEAVAYILRARMGAKATTFDSFYRLAWEDRPGFSGEEETPPDLVGFPLFAFCPEWPERPFLSIDRTTRKRRIDQLKPPCPLADELGRDLLKLADAANNRDWTKIGQTVQSIQTPWLWYAGFEIDWRKFNETLIAEFTDWLRDNRPSEIVPIGTGHTGAGSKPRQIRCDLKALGTFRLLRKYTNWKKAHAAIIGEGKRSFLSANESAWSREKMRATRILQLPFRDLF